MAITMTPSYLAGGTIAANSIVKLDGTNANTVVVATSGTVPVGIAQNYATTGEPVAVDPIINGSVAWLIGTANITNANTAVYVADDGKFSTTAGSNAIRIGYLKAGALDVSVDDIAEVIISN